MSPYIRAEAGIRWNSSGEPRSRLKKRTDARLRQKLRPHIKKASERRNVPGVKLVAVAD